METKHISMIGLGVTAIGAIVGILYYRSRSNADASQDNAFTGFPYFQTAAIPGGGASDQGPVSSTVNDGSGSNDTIDIGAILQSQKDLALIAANKEISLANIDYATNEQNNFFGLLGSAASGQISRMSNPFLTQGYINKTAAGGYTFAVETTPAGGLPYGGLWGSPQAPQTGNSQTQNFGPGQYIQTNSTPYGVSATVLQ
jgi:hypothetical protein